MDKVVYGKKGSHSISIHLLIARLIKLTQFKKTGSKRKNFISLGFNVRDSNDIKKFLCREKPVSNFCIQNLVSWLKIAYLS